MSPENENDLKRLLESGKDAQVSLALHDLASGYQLMVHPNVPFHPASTFKLGVMMEVFHQEAQGRLSLDDRLPVKNVFLSIADQSEFSLSPEDDSDKELYLHIGKRMPLRELNLPHDRQQQQPGDEPADRKGRRKPGHRLHAGIGNQ